MRHAAMGNHRTNNGRATRRWPNSQPTAWSRWLLTARRLLVLAASLSIGDVCLASGHGASPEPAEAAAEAPPTDVNSNGIFLGEFDIRSHYPVKAQKSDVQFVLYASASEDKRAQARHVAGERRHKIRDQVIVTTRLAPLADFDEPDLKRFRRRILLCLRRALPELVIDDVYVSEFQIKVQSL